MATFLILHRQKHKVQLLLSSSLMSVCVHCMFTLLTVAVGNLCVTFLSAEKSRKDRVLNLHDTLRKRYWGRIKGSVEEVEQDLGAFLFYMG